MDARLFTLALLLAWLPQGGIAGIDRGGEALAICLLSPAAGPEREGLVRAISPLPDPTIFARGEFAEIRLEEDGQVLWRRLASGDQPLQGPLAWPLDELRPGQQVLLRLRPIEVGASEFANVELVGASAETLARSSRLRRTLGRDPAAWLRAVIREMRSGSSELGLALLFDFNGPSSPELNALRREIHDQACDSALNQPVSTAR